MITMKGKYNSANIFIDQIDETTREQIQGFLNHPAFAKSYIAIMPDCHAGVGAVVGLTMTMNGYVIPNIVGVDIGCGVLAAKLNKNKILPFELIDGFIRNEIPCGFKSYEKPQSDYSQLNKLEQVCQSIEYDPNRALRSLGTLGGGNHFIEIGVDSADEMWLLVHSGSRNFGLSVANAYQKKAKDALGTYFIRDDFRGLEFIPPETYLTHMYLFSMGVAQEFAKENRFRIMSKIANYLGGTVRVIESVHNYIDLEHNIIRKGAISAYKDEWCVIPLNMRDGTLIGVGKGSSKFNFSAPHGAGRTMSRKKAKEVLSLDVFQKGMKDAGIFTTTATADTLDEAPEAYKNAEVIMESIEETVSIRTKLRPVYNFKAVEK
jgi:tRNA-splicing ligase RtcB (3'-phosphate/5'-hydroxy nucleic acid ligase)